MSVKFRKRIRVFPGFSLNLSKSGLSATLGVKGLSVNVGKNGNYLNTGISGTGLYDRKRIDENSQNLNSTLEQIPEPQNSKYSYSVETEIKSYNPELLTSNSLAGLKQSILAAEKVKKEMYLDWQEANSSKNKTLFSLVVLHCLIIGFFLKPLKESYKNKKRFAEELKQDYEKFALNIDFNFDNDSLNDYISLKKSFESLMSSQKIWDITSYTNIDSIRERTAATRSLTRRAVGFYENSLDFIKTKYEAFVFGNANGGNLYLYPGFIVMKEDNSKEFALIDLKTLNFNFATSHFIEEESVPSDSETIGNTWKYCNKNGSPDRRYSNNYKIPIQLYGEISFSSNEGMNEKYMISNEKQCEEFASLLANYIDTFKKMNWSTKTES